MDNRHSEAPAAADADAAAAAAAVPWKKWVECSSCSRWRGAPDDVDVGALPKDWSCEDNRWDPRHASCRVEQQISNDEIDAIVDAQDEAMEGYETAPDGDDDEEEDDDDDDEDLSLDEQEERAAADAAAAERAAAEAAAAAARVPSAAAPAPSAAAAAAAAAAVAAAADAAAEEAAAAGWLRTENQALASLRNRVTTLHELHDADIEELQGQDAKVQEELEQVQKEQKQLQGQYAKVQEDLEQLREQFAAKRKERRDRER